MKTSLRSLAVTLLTASALVLPAASAIAVDEVPDRVLTVGVDIAAGWIWTSGSPEGCTVSQVTGTGVSVTVTTEPEPKLIEATSGATMEVTGCGALTPVAKMAKTTKRKKVVGDGDWLVGPHFVKGATYVGKPTKETFGFESGTATCNWTAHKSLTAFDDHFGFPDKEGRLKVTSKMKVIETDDDCVWKRVA